MAFPTITVTPGTGTTVNTLPNAGQALATDSLPVVLTAAQLAALTPLATVGVTGAFFQATQPVQIVPGATGGWSPSRVKAAATTNATGVKASPGQIGGYALFNNAAATRFVKFYDLAAAPTVGTSTPLFTVILPAGAGANVSFPGGVQCAAGVAYAVTAGVADADATATAADDVHGVILFK